MKKMPGKKNISCECEFTEVGNKVNVGVGFGVGVIGGSSSSSEMGVKSCAEAGILSRLFFWWMNDLLVLGYKRELKSHDLKDQLLKRDSSFKLSSKIYELWSQQQQINNNKQQQQQPPSLLNVICKQFGWEYFAMGILPFIEECGVRILQPILLGIVIRKLENSTTPPYIEATLIVLCSVMNVFTTHWFYFSVQHVGMRVRIACSCLIYRKCLKQLKSPDGKLLNLLSSDVQRFDQSSVYLHYLWIGPCNLIIVFSVLYYMYGTASFVGLTFLILFTLLQAFLGIQFSKLRTKTAGQTDLRMDFMAKMLRKMKQIKLLGLEDLYTKTCQQLRQSEISFIRKSSYLRAINLTFFYSSVKIIFFLTIWWHGSIQTETVFVTLSLFNNVRNLMTNYFPNGVLQFAEAKVAIKRIEDYLNEPDHEQSSIQAEDKSNHIVSIQLKNIPLKGQNEKLNLDINNGDIISIVGGVGCGKTTLLRTLLGEFKPEGSTITIHGKIGYVPQTPWIYPGSMEDNIILNHPYDPIWYEKVISACSLKDYGQISTESLSGGMRSRISLARAVYSQADIYLFDDPFASLDGYTKKHICNELMNNLLVNKIIIICGGDINIGRIISLDGHKTEKRRESMKIEYGINSIMKKSPSIEEVMKIGSVRWKTYFEYFWNGCGWFGLLGLILINLICQISFSGARYYLRILTSDDAPDNSMTYYGILVCTLVISSLIRTVMFFRVCLNSSIQIHDKIFEKVLTSKLEFFLTHGKILNRFGKDMGLMDESLPTTFFSAASVLLHVLGTIVIISIVQPFLLIPAVILTIMFYSLRKFYIRTGRAVRRIEAIGRTPLYTLVSSTGSGLSTIRCFSAEDKFLYEFNSRLDTHSASWYINLAASRWFGIWLDWISVVYTAIVVASFLTTSQQLGSDAGLAISSVLFLSGTFQLGARQSADVENQMISVERILDYQNIPTEDFTTGESDLDVKAPIEFKDVSVTYDNVNVLKNVNFVINKGEKVALLGRTGCGKTTLLKALYRLADYTGNVEIGNIDTENMTLKKLRSSISMIPQEPYIFQGTIRDNLDPHCKFTDDEICRVYNRFGGFFENLYSKVDVDGRNLSQGQKQILSLLRVILKQNDILVLDEPTANLDSKTDDLIKESLKEFCAHCTVITVAHRMSTIADYDRIFIIQDGELKETQLPKITNQIVINEDILS